MKVPADFLQPTLILDQRRLEWSLKEVAPPSMRPVEPSHGSSRDTNHQQHGCEAVVPSGKAERQPLIVNNTGLTPLPLDSLVLLALGVLAGGFFAFGGQKTDIGHSDSPGEIGLGGIPGKHGSLCALCHDQMEDIGGTHHVARL